MTRFQKLVVATTTVTFLLIGLGGFVRAAGAGLGCPDWPKCFGRWIPPTEASQLPDDIDPELFNFQLAWIEYVNRLVGVTVGLLILATAWLAWRDHRGDPPVLVPALAAVPLVAFQGWFGGQVVAHELDPRFVTVHLLVAVAIIAVLIAAAAHSFPKPVRDETADLKRQFHLVRAGLVLVLLQICLGALVRGSIDLAAERFPALERGALLGETGWLDGAHRIPRSGGAGLLRRPCPCRRPGLQPHPCLAAARHGAAGGRFGAVRGRGRVGLVRPSPGPAGRPRPLRESPVRQPVPSVPSPEARLKPLPRSGRFFFFARAKPLAAGTGGSPGWFQNRREKQGRHILRGLYSLAPKRTA